MESFEPKFATFVDILRKTDATLASDKTVPVLKAALLAAKFDQIGGSVIVRKKKKLNGYNLFMKDRMVVLKETESDSNKRMSKISGEWKQLTEEQKGGWNGKAKELSEAPVKLQIKIKDKSKPQRWSGYQMYVSENMSKLVDIKPKERMKTIGGQWKGLSDTEKETYKAKALAKTAEAQAKATATAQS